MTTQTTPEHNEGLLLPGLDGTNPLGFLAAMGLFRVLDASHDPGQIRLQWTALSGTWIPMLFGSGLNPESVLRLIAENLSSTIESHPIRILKGLGVDESSQRRSIFQQLTNEAHINHRIHTEWLAALASDIIPSSAINQLQTTRRDYFYGNLTSVIRDAKSEHLQRAIFSPWDYADSLDNQSLHWDPSEDRRHAHQWNKPAGDPDRKTCGGMLGANRLAIEAFALFTSLPKGDALQTVGFTGQRSRDTQWTWPIWNVPLSLSVVWSLLLLPELQSYEVTVDVRTQMRHRGIVAVYRTSRILVGKTPNFTPAKCIA